LNVEITFYIDGDVEKMNVAGYINISTDKREEIENVIWEYHDVDIRPWNKQEWGYIMTRSIRQWTKRGGREDKVAISR
jgi:hypothetical protein